MNKERLESLGRLVGDGGQLAMAQKFTRIIESGGLYKDIAPEMKYLHPSGPRGTHQLVQGLPQESPMQPNGFVATTAHPRLLVPKGSLHRLDIQAGEVVLAVQLVRFAPDTLDSGVFSTWGIAMPAQIARSTPKRREEFFYGRLAAAYALSALSVPAPVEASARRITNTTVGIGMQREPLWPTGIVGSISHCAGLAAAVVVPRTRLNGIGIDIERVAGVEACAALQQVALNEIEVAHLRAVSMQCPLEFWLTAAFSAKESFYKGVFRDVGRFFGFEVAQLRAVDLRRKCLRFQLTESLSDHFRLGDAFEVSFERLDSQTVMTHFSW